MLFDCVPLLYNVTMKFMTNTILGNCSSSADNEVSSRNVFVLLSWSYISPCTVDFPDLLTEYQNSVKYGSMEKV